jgi:hypothetical protein
MKKEFDNKKFENTFNKHKALLKEALNIKEHTTKEWVEIIMRHPKRKEIVKDMRDWVKDCQWGDVESPEEVDEFSDAEIIRGVNKAYDGGVEEFIRGNDYGEFDMDEIGGSYGEPVSGMSESSND